MKVFQKAIDNKAVVTAAIVMMPTSGLSGSSACCKTVITKTSVTAVGDHMFLSCLLVQ